VLLLTAFRFYSTRLRGGARTGGRWSPPTGQEITVLRAFFRESWCRPLWLGSIQTFVIPTYAGFALKSMDEHSGSFPKTPIHSARSKIRGSTESARCAGIQVASSPNNNIASTTPDSTSGSRGVA